MGIREIPKAYEYMCDSCGEMHKQENANGHYNDSRPPHWTRLKIARHAYDFKGRSGADGSIERLLCPSCSERVYSAVNAAMVKQAP